MKLLASIEESGFFWTPDKPERRFPGILKISESGDINLKITSLSNINPGERLFGDPLVPIPFMVFSRIIGVIQRGYVTLENCRGESRKVRFGSIATISINARIAFIGAGYEESDDIMFSKFCFSVEGLDEWLSVPGSQMSQKLDEGNRIRGVTMDFSTPEEISVNLPDDEMKLRFDFEFSFLGTFEVKITQKAHIELESKELRLANDFFEISHQIFLFLRFAIGSNISITSITGYPRDIVLGRENREVPIEIFFRHNATFEKNVKIDYYKMLLTYNDIQDRIQDVIVNWLRGYRKFKPAFNLYFSYESGAYRNLEGQFLSLVQGLEAIHRRDSQEKTMPDDEFEGIKRKVLSVIPKSRRSWMEGRIRYANELSMRKRLAKMIEPFQDFYGSNKERNSFIDAVVDMRNNLIHSNPDPSKSASNIGEMYVLSIKLQSLFQLHILKILGMDGKNIEEIVQENHILRRNLKLSEGDISIY